MIQVGKINQLNVANLASFGVYLDAGTGNRKDNVLLPGNECPDDIKEGDNLEVFIYHDSEDRLIATRQKPLAQAGELAYLNVTAKTKFGAFLDFGLERGLFLPFREQKYPIEVDKSYLVYLYLDKSGRLSSTTDITDFLSSASPYQKNDSVTGTVYQIHPDIGVFVAVDNQYLGLIPRTENYSDLKWGDRVQARVIRVRDDGKLDLSSRNLSHQQMNVDAELLINAMNAHGGILPLNEKASPEEIEKVFHLSKAAFKRAVGTLLKSGRIKKHGDELRLP
ncbi:CvfB family protein [Desulfitobacterium hafniense]|uniref:RNA-binding protein n=1 Tax=Desulfitobacterium hafniense TaxID=49338 RepID=A0A0W1JI59_DESHA|nr:S1-like domain-containing RNA-binding protein [Desulfitobacterium hafniense]KTE91200.1 RNA-binding protein [Desulfitobacterium hafniense]